MSAAIESRITAPPTALQAPPEVAAATPPIEAVTYLQRHQQPDGAVKLGWIGAARLKYGIEYVIAPGKGLEKVTDQLTGRQKVVAKTPTKLVGAALGFIWNANNARTPITAIFSGTNTLPGSEVTEAELMAEEAERVGGLPKRARKLDINAVDTEGNAIGAAKALEGVDVEGKVAVVTDAECQQTVVERLRDHGIPVAQVLLFENVLRHEPGYEQTIVEYEKELTTSTRLVKREIYKRSYRHRITRAIMHQIALRRTDRKPALAQQGSSA